ncbi:hypothetical protein QTP86_013920, partial [Hemibagrus guttatus]
LSHLVVFMIGTVVVVFVNAVALFAELILKARNGERTVDLRVILVPAESVFVACYLALQISSYLKIPQTQTQKIAKVHLCGLHFHLTDMPIKTPSDCIS